MNVRMPKSFATLPQSEKDKINDVMTEQVLKEVNHNMAELQKIWLQYACIVLNKNFGLDKDQLACFIADWHNVYTLNNKFKDKSEQTEYLTKEMSNIFGEGGYPYRFIDKMEDLQ